MNSQASLDDDVENDVRRIWTNLATKMAVIPLDPMDLDLVHLARAERQGVDVRALLATPRSEGEPEPGRPTSPVG